MKVRALRGRFAREANTHSSGLNLEIESGVRLPGGRQVLGVGSVHLAEIPARQSQVGLAADLRRLVLCQDGLVGLLERHEFFDLAAHLRLPPGGVRAGSGPRGLCGLGGLSELINGLAKRRFLFLATGGPVPIACTQGSAFVASELPPIRVLL